MSKKKAGSRADEFNSAATKIQCSARKFLAVRRVIDVSKEHWQRIFDPAVKKYFFYNKVTGQSVWKTPFLLKEYEEDDHWAATQMQKIVRGFNARNRMRKIARNKYTKYYDAKSDNFYYIDKELGETFWTPSLWLLKQNIPLPPEDQFLYDSIQKIKELEEKLRKKDDEIKLVKQKQLQELEKEVIRDKVKTVKDLKRSKHMDDWTIDQMAAWFIDLKMEEYIPFLYNNR